MIFSSNKLGKAERVIYIIMWILIGLIIYRLNDDNQPLLGFFSPGYLIPCLIYSAVVVLVSFCILQISKVLLRTKVVALCVAILVGIPFGIYVVFHFTNWLFR